MAAGKTAGVKGSDGGSSPPHSTRVRIKKNRVNYETKDQSHGDG